MGGGRYLLVAVGVALVGCGDDNSADVAQVERDLARVVEQQTGTDDVSVSCPTDVAEGDVCEVTAAGGLWAQVRVTRIGDGAEGEVISP